MKTCTSSTIRLRSNVFPVSSGDGHPRVDHGTQQVHDQVRHDDEQRTTIALVGATSPLSSQAGWSQAQAAADRLQAELVPDAMLVIASPGSSTQPPSLTVLRLTDTHDAQRLGDQLDALVAEFRELAHRLAIPFRLHIEPAYDHGDWYPDRLDVDGETWSLHIHGEHCQFTSLERGTEIEVHTDRPDAIDPWFLLQYAKSTQRYPEICTACLEGFHDICRMLALADITLDPPDRETANG